MTRFLTILTILAFSASQSFATPVDLVVTSGRRSEGVGRLLLDAATAWARERGCDQFVLDSGNGRKDAHRFYAAQGMEQGNLNFTREIDAPS